MAFSNTAAVRAKWNRHVAVAIVVLLFFVLYNVPHAHISKLSGISNTFAGSIISTKPHASPVTRFLPLAEAETFCKAYRWQAYPKRETHRKIYDLVLINTELDWLEIRMGQMDEYVDYFVIVESDKTFTDHQKALAVKENWDRFAKYHHKIIRHTLNHADSPSQDTWSREGFARDAMYTQVFPFLKDAQSVATNDVILVSDVDEIPRPEALKAMRNCLFPRGLTLRSHMYYYSFQWLLRDSWPHPQATFYEGEDTILPQALRNTNNPDAQLYHGAWHCSYCFSTLGELVKKITSFSHTEMNRPEFRDVKKIMERVRWGTDFYDRQDQHFDRVDANPDVPGYVRANKHKYAFVLDRDPLDANFRDYAEYDWGLDDSVG